MSEQTTERVEELLDRARGSRGVGVRVNIGTLKTIRSEIERLTMGQKNILDGYNRLRDRYDALREAVREAKEALNTAKRAMTNRWHDAPRRGMEDEYEEVVDARDHLSHALEEGGEPSPEGFRNHEGDVFIPEACTAHDYTVVASGNVIYFHDDPNACPVHGTEGGEGQGEEEGVPIPNRRTWYQRALDWLQGHASGLDTAGASSEAAFFLGCYDRANEGGWIQAVEALEKVIDRYEGTGNERLVAKAKNLLEIDRPTGDEPGGGSREAYDRAVENAVENYESWRDTTGAIGKGTSLDYELREVVKHAVQRGWHMGRRVERFRLSDRPAPEDEGENLTEGTTASVPCQRCGHDLARHAYGGCDVCDCPHDSLSDLTGPNVDAPNEDEGEDDAHA